MLSKIKFEGFKIISSKFFQNENIEEDGSYSIGINDALLEHREVEHSNNSIILLQVSSTPNIKGYNQSDAEKNTPTFEVDLSMRLMFHLPNEENFDINYLHENTWFFDNFITISTKLAVENILQYSYLDGIKLQW